MRNGLLYCLFTHRADKYGMAQTTQPLIPGLMNVTLQHPDDWIAFSDPDNIIFGLAAPHLGEDVFTPIIRVFPPIQPRIAPQTSQDLIDLTVNTFKGYPHQMLASSEGSYGKLPLSYTEIGFLASGNKQMVQITQSVLIPIQGTPTVLNIIGNLSVDTPELYVKQMRQVIPTLKITFGGAQ